MEVTKPTRHLLNSKLAILKTRTTKDKLVSQVGISCITFLVVRHSLLQNKVSSLRTIGSEWAIIILALICIAQSVLQGLAWRALLTIDELQLPSTRQCMGKLLPNQKKNSEHRGTYLLSLH